MKSYPNIDRSGFRHRQYVGYAEGAIYRITKTENGRWLAMGQNVGDAFTRRTLAEISDALTATAISRRAA